MLGSTLIQCKADNEKVVVPEGIKCIGHDAFKGWLKYSQCYIEIRRSEISWYSNKPDYSHVESRISEPFWIRPMMWITKG